MNIKMKHDRVLIEKVELEWKTAGGLYLGVIEKERENGFGRVIAVGPGKQVDSNGIIPTTTKIGEIVTFNDRVAIPVSYEGKIYYWLRENEIIFTVEGGNFGIKEFQTEGDDYERSNIVRNIN